MPQKMNDQPHRHFFIRIFRKTHCTDITRLLIHCDIPMSVCLSSMQLLCTVHCDIPMSVCLSSMQLLCTVHCLLRHGCQERESNGEDRLWTSRHGPSNPDQILGEKTTLGFVDRASRYDCAKENQLDAQLILSIFPQPLHVSGVSRPIIRRYNCMSTTIGTYYF